MGLLLLFLLLPTAWAGNTIDGRFDKTGDGIVDAADWPQLTEDERAQYARLSIQDLGENPDVLLPDGKTRQEHFLQGLNEVYQ